jgi:hypothetical protein
MFIFMCRHCVAEKDGIEGSAAFISTVPMCPHCGRPCLPIFDSQLQPILVTSERGREMAHCCGFSDADIDAEYERLS